MAAPAAAAGSHDSGETPAMLSIARGASRYVIMLLCAGGAGAL
jgi:hypothetical protein